MRTLLSVLGSLIAAAGTAPYILETIRGNTKPRIVTWLTWALLTGVAGAASLSAGHLGGAVFALLGTVATGSVVVAGLRYGDRSFTTLDLACLAGVLLGLLLWLSLDNPIFAVWAAILIDFVGLAPTLVHAWKQPTAETASTFLCVGVGGLITSAAIASGGSFSVAALGYPLYAAVSMGSVAAIIVIRRKSVTPERGAQVADRPDDDSGEPAPALVSGVMRPADEEFVPLTEAVARYGREVGPCKAYSTLRSHAAKRGRVTLGGEQIAAYKLHGRWAVQRADLERAINAEVSNRTAHAERVAD